MTLAIDHHDAQWPYALAEQEGMHPDYVANAYFQVTGTSISRAALHQAAQSGVPMAEFAALTDEQARRMPIAMRQIRAEIHGATGCHYCGLPLSNGECAECGSQKVGQMLGFE